MFKKLIVVDGKGHLAGRLASYIAKEALNGQKISIIRCEKVLISGSKYRNKLKIWESMYAIHSKHRSSCLIVKKCTRPFN